MAPARCLVSSRPTLAALLNFIPYAGPTATLLVLTAVAIISFDEPGRIIAVAASFLGLATVEGQFVQPLLVGRRYSGNHFGDTHDGGAQGGGCEF